MFVPWTMKNRKGELVGFEVDVAKKIAQNMGVRPQFKTYLWGDIIPALEKGDVYVIIAGMTITRTRALRVKFTKSYVETEIFIAANTVMTRDFDSFTKLTSRAEIISTLC